MLFFATDLDLYNECRIIVQFSRLSHTYIMLSHMRNYSNVEKYAETAQ